jgi:hypothetical protein
MKCLTAFCEAVGPGFVFDRVRDTIRLLLFLFKRSSTFVQSTQLGDFICWSAINSECALSNIFAILFCALDAHCLYDV